MSPAGLYCTSCALMSTDGVKAVLEEMLCWSNSSFLWFDSAYCKKKIIYMYITNVFTLPISLKISGSVTPARSNCIRHSSWPQTFADGTQSWAAPALSGLGFKPWRGTGAEDIWALSLSSVETKVSFWQKMSERCHIGGDRDFLAKWLHLSTEWTGYLGGPTRHFFLVI